MLSKTIKSNYALTFSCIIGLVIFFISKDYGMFWDNVFYASKIGNFLFENGIFYWNFPSEMDIPHPPFLGFILAISWKIIGHELWVSHLVIIPFVVGTIYQLYRLVFYYTNNVKNAYLGLFLILADPSLLTQFVLVNHEVIIFFFFFLSVNSILYKNKYQKLFGLLFLSIISTRGLMLTFGLLFFELTYNFVMSRKTIKDLFKTKLFISYFFAFIPSITFIP